MKNEEPFTLTSQAAKKLSKLGASKGGEARASKLSADRRSEIARAAVGARWAKAGKEPMPRATHKGSFKEEFGTDVDCYVLDDERKTAVISQTGMGQALGLSSRGNAFPRFLASKSMAGFIGAQLSEKIAQPLRFQWGSGGALALVHGFDATLLIDVCKAIIAAESEGRLNRQQMHVASQAHIILGASAKAGIKGLVYALAGYDATKEEVIAAFKFYVREEARDYEKEFPDQLYEEWYRLYELPKPERSKPWKFMHLTIDQVYKPLAKSNGKILELTKLQRESSNARWKKLHQFLSEIGVKALRTQLGQLLGIARISKSKREYESHFQTLFGEQFILFKDDLESQP
jgi:P63C domain